MADILHQELDDSFRQTGHRADRPVKRGKKVAKLKEARYSKKDPLPRKCNHKNSKAYECGTFSQEDAEYFNALLYSKPGKKTQDNFIALYLVTSNKERERKRNEKPQRRKRESGETRYYMRGKDSADKRRVCKDYFLRVNGEIGRRRVENISSDIHKTGCLRKENRGGDKKSLKFADRVRKIQTFIRSMPGRESHYGRGKSKKIYLPAELCSIKKLWKMFLEKHNEEHHRVSYKYFLNCVRKHFRIGFGSIKTDTCSFCESHKYQIKAASDAVTKARLMAEFTVHKRRGNVFYELINETRSGLKTFAFDHQQNLVLPRVPDQQAYYSRQFYVYNFTVVQIDQDGKLTPENVTAYTWNEDSFRKDSSSCASAVFDALKNADLTDIDTVRLCADGCGGTK